VLRREGTTFGFLVLLLVAAGLKEPRLFQPQSLESILLWMPLIAVVAMGQLMVVLTGGIDLSVGAALGFAGIAVGLMLKSNPNLPLPLALGAGLAIGLALGVVNAALVVWGKVSPLIVTIGTLASYRGLTFIVSKGDQIDSSMIPDRLTSLAHTGVPVGPVTVSWLLVMVLVVVVVTAVFLSRVPLGRDLFAVGSNAEAAHLRGIPVNRAKFWAFAACGALAGLAGVMYAARFGFVNPGSAGQNFELTVIAAVAIGGTKLTGGSGSVLGVFLGCLLLSCINVSLSLLGIDANWQMLTYGAVILVGVLVDAWAPRSRA